MMYFLCFTLKSRLPSERRWKVCLARPKTLPAFRGTRERFLLLVVPAVRFLSFWNSDSLEEVYIKNCLLPHEELRGLWIH